MAIRRILKEGDETLRKISRPVQEIDKRTKQLLDDMAETMYANDGAGPRPPRHSGAPGARGRARAEQKGADD